MLTKHRPFFSWAATPVSIDKREVLLSHSTEGSALYIVECKNISENMTSCYLGNPVTIAMKDIRLHCHYLSDMISHTVNVCQCKYNISSEGKYKMQLYASNNV